MCARSFVLSLVALSVSSLVGCGASDGAPASAPPESPITVTQTGTILDFTTKLPVAGATVTAGDKTAITDATGAYTFAVQAGLPFTMSVTAPDHARLFMQERSIDADVDDGPVQVVTEATATSLRGGLDGFRQDLGSVTVKVIPTESCASAEGATVSVSPAGAAQVRYFAHGVPSPSQTSVSADEFPSAVVYNVQPGVPLTVSVTHPTCKQSPFPVRQRDVTYTGQLDVQAGDATTYASLFLR